MVGCDGERAWQWFGDVPPDAEVTFDRRPELPVPELLAPVWLLLGYRLTVEGETTAAGRPGIAVTGTARTSPFGELVAMTFLPWGLDRRPDRVSAVIDAELGIVLRRELRSRGGRRRDGVPALPSATRPTLRCSPRRRELLRRRTERRAGRTPPADEVGLAALKMVGGLAAGGLGAVIKYTPKRQADPFAAATAEDPDDAMPDDEPLPGWTSRRPPTGRGRRRGPADDADGGTPVSDEVLDLLYRGGLGPAPFSGTLLIGPTASCPAARCCAGCRSRPGGPGSAGSGSWSTRSWPMTARRAHCPPGVPRAGRRVGQVPGRSCPPDAAGSGATGVTATR